MNIILLGIKHSGKTTVGRALAAALGVDFFDTDDVIKNVIEKDEGLDARSLFQLKGKDAFMAAERAACDYIVGLKRKNLVIATGGGICDNSAALEVLRPFGIFIFLDTTESVAFGRVMKEAVKTSGGWENLPAFITRPFGREELTKKEVACAFSTFYKKRHKAYLALSPVVIKNSKSIADTVDSIKKAIEDLSANEKISSKVSSFNAFGAHATFGGGGE